MIRTELDLNFDYKDNRDFRKVLILLVFTTMVVGIVVGTCLTAVYIRFFL